MPRLEYGGMIMAHCNLDLTGSCSLPVSASCIARTISTCYHVWLSFVFLVEMGFLHVGQAGLELPTSGDPAALASQSAKIIGVSHMLSLSLLFLTFWLLGSSGFANSLDRTVLKLC